MKKIVVSEDEMAQLARASELKSLGKLKEATQVLLAMIEDYPQSAIAYNSLGGIYFAEGKGKEALAAYHHAIRLRSDYVDAYYNLALTFNKLNRYEEALHAYQAVLALSPQHAGAQFQIGCLLMRQQRYEAASDYFKSFLVNHPDHLEAHSNLATCYLKNGVLQAAKQHYLQALAIEPQDQQILFNLGTICMQEGQLTAAIDYYLRLLTHNPNHFAAHNNLGVVYLALKDKPTALRHFREALRLQPGNEAVRQTIQLMMRDASLAAAPPEYIRSLFDSYADHYDLHLNETLQYQLPAQFYQLVTQYGDQHKKRDILDLGCGTGLCGEAFKPLARWLVGVDLSEKMLAVAAQKNLFDELIKADAELFLKDKKAQYDLIIAGDVFVYVGELTSLLQAIYHALREEGQVIFNAEIGETEAYHLSETGRFQHSQYYLQRIITQCGFHIRAHKVAPIRTQDHQTVYGQVYLLEKPVILSEAKDH